MQFFEQIVYADVTIAHICYALGLFILGILLTKFGNMYLRRMLKEHFDRDQSAVIVRLFKYVIITILFLTVLPLLGVDLSGLIVAGGIIGVAVGFASQSILSNLISGIFLMIERPIKIGDAVNIDSVDGIVDSINIMSTTLRGFDGLYVRIPNSKVFTSDISNYDTNRVRRFQYIIGIRYQDDANKAIKVLKQVICDESLALVNPKPRVFVDELADSSVNIKVWVWAPASEWITVKRRLLWKLKIELEKNGIEIPFPQRVVWMNNVEENS